jgi:GAF domain-containing protein
MLANAVRICEAKAGNIYRWKDDTLRLVTTHNTPPGFAEFLRRTPLHATANNPVGRMQKTKSLVHTADLTAQQPYIERSDPAIVAAVDLGSVRTQLSVPLLKQNEFIGAITLWRDEVRPFDNKQIALVQSFAAQAVIAIENARLLNELRQRTTDLTESLEQQTATTEVLRVISSSPGELQTVFQTLLGNGLRLCVADFGLMFQYDGTRLELMAERGANQAYIEYMQHGLDRPSPDTVVGQIIKSRAPVQFDDYTNSRAYRDRDPLAVMAVERGGVRTIAAVPMLREDELIGVIALYRQEVRPFTDKQTELLQSFAAQAVIAIENARLLNELRESLEQQTATSKVLEVISSSPGDLKPVFDAILENSTRICQAGFGLLHLAEGNVFRNAARYNVPAAYDEVRQREPLMSMTGNTAIARVAKTMSAVQIADAAADPVYREDPRREQFVTLTGVRTVISVPMLKDDTLIGVITVYRLEVRPFTDKQIESLQNFAAQAVIAIENARLLHELRESLQ